MNLFTWLFIGHLVGDWLLQNDWMAKGKRKKVFHPGGLVHYTIYTVTLLVVFSFGSTSVGVVNMLVVAIIAFVTHLIIDGTNIVSGWINLLKQTDIPMVRVMVDQTFHMLVLMVIVLYGQNM